MRDERRCTQRLIESRQETKKDSPPAVDFASFTESPMTLPGTPSALLTVVDEEVIEFDVVEVVVCCFESGGAG